MEAWGGCFLMKKNVFLDVLCQQRRRGEKTLGLLERFCWGATKQIKELDSRVIQTAIKGEGLGGVELGEGGILGRIQKVAKIIGTSYASGA